MRYKDVPVTCHAEDKTPPAGVPRPTIGELNMRSAKGEMVDDQLAMWNCEQTNDQALGALSPSIPKQSPLPLPTDKFIKGR